MISARAISAAAPPSPLPASPPILYLSLDGMLEPLGRSQVLSYVYRLNDAGFSFAIVSLEREQDITAAAVSRLTHELRARNIEWRWDRFHQGGIRPAFRNLRSLFHQARGLTSMDGFAAVHARSLLPALVARLLKFSHGIPYLFDLRGYWVEEKAAEGAWVTNPFTFAIGKKIERHLIEQASAVVTLTAIHEADVKARCPNALVTVIPTCADYEVFIRDANQDAIPEEVSARLRGKLVIGMVGSLSKSYRTLEALQLFSELRRLRPDAHLLCVTRQVAQMKAAISQSGIADSDCTLLSSAHEQMPAWVSLMDWALLLLSDGLAKRGAVPTKLAEFFSAEVRIVHYGCNSEVAGHVGNTGAGIVLEDLSIEALRRAAQQIASAPRTSESAAKARTLTRAHFGLESGAQKYRDLFHRIIKAAPSLASRAVEQGRI